VIASLGIEKIGSLVVSGIMASSVSFGTLGLPFKGVQSDQFPMVFQSELTNPFHVQLRSAFTLVVCCPNKVKQNITITKNLNMNKNLFFISTPLNPKCFSSSHLRLQLAGKYCSEFPVIDAW
jgi:hypothetical protein